MGIFSRFEGKVEDTFEGAANRMAKAPISPVQIAKKAEKQMRREKMVGAGKQYAPTLYTVLVNTDDDQRLFGYYPTLAGETETYLAAKAMDEGLVMDGQPLVRFIADDGLRRGKFEVIAEMVASPIIAQLREEEMERYGLLNHGHSRNNVRSQQPQAQPNFPQNQPRQAPYDPFQPQGVPLTPQQPLQDPFMPRDAQPAPLHKEPLPYVPEEEIDYSVNYGEYTFNSEDFDDYRERGGEMPVEMNRRRVSEPFANPEAGANAFVAASEAGRAGAAGAGAADAANAVGVAGAGAAGAAGAAAAGAGAAGAGAAGVAGFNAAPPDTKVPNTVVFSAGSGNARPTANRSMVRAYLIDASDNRTYDLATSRILLGRETQNDIVVDDINASRTHAEITYEPQGAWVITDLGSTNGTLVNGREITSQVLNDNDYITIGMTNFVFARA